MIDFGSQIRVLILVLFAFRCVGEGVRDEGLIFQKFGLDVRLKVQLFLVSFVYFLRCVLSLSSIVFGVVVGSLCVVLMC